MPQYTLKVNDLGYRTVDAVDLEDASSKADIAKGDPYELVEGDDFGDEMLNVCYY